ncbi:Endonuclease-reverse transcriptase [Popillia japonica]|uniref:Endonuclease-reverse transcriptase n=1 Tax=Popillia japonica TaxID=7064 RepID=A0AAW1KLE2_POPJA
MGSNPGRKKQVIIAGDINAKSHLWGSPTIDKKGEHWSEWIAALNLVVQNTGLTQTFVHAKIAARVMDWQVLEEESLTEHRFISYVVRTKKPPRDPSEKRKVEEESLTEHRFISYVVRTKKPPRDPSEKRKYETDWDAFNANLKLRLINRTSKEICSYKMCANIIKEAYINICSYKMCANIIKEAYINSSKEGPKGKGEKIVPYWWSEEISAKRKECIMSRRSLPKMTKKCGNDEKKLQKLKKEKCGNDEKKLQAKEN